MMDKPWETCDRCKALGELMAKERPWLAAYPAWLCADHEREWKLHMASLWSNALLEKLR